MFRWVCNILIVIIISVLLSACNKDSAGAPAFPGDEAVSSDGIPLKIRYTCTAREYRTLAELKQAKINDRYTYKEYSFLPKEMGFLKSAGFFLKPVKMSELGADEDMRGYVQYDDMVDLYIQYARILRPEEYIEGMEGFNPSYNLVPYYISADYVFHIFRLMLSRMTQQIEEDRFYPLIRDLTSSLLNESIRRYENTSDHGLKNEFKKAAAFFLVPASVMNIEPRKKIDAITTLAEPAIAAMRNENGMVRIEITGTTEDFTQYIPRGYYTKNDTMEKYFKVMMWYGRMYFPADKPVVPLIISSMTTQGENLKRWKSLYDTTSFLVGESEDITIFQVREGALKILGSAAVPGKYPDRAKITRFVQYLKSLKGPRILSASGIKAKKGATTGERVEAQRGFRFIGQRFIPDSYIFTRTTGEVGSDEHPRNIPKGLDVMGILGSHAAETLLKNDFTSIVNLKKEYDKVKNEFSRYQQKEWRQNVYWAWLDTIHSLFDNPHKNLPPVFSKKAWPYRMLLTAHGSWAELRHDTVLYAKQSYAEKGGEGETVYFGGQPYVPRGYVEPNVRFFDSLYNLTVSLRTRLKRSSVMPDDYEKRFRNFEKILKRLKIIAEKQIAGETVNDNDFIYIAGFNHEVSAMITPENAGEMGQAEKQMAIITDVHTDTFSNQVLQVGTGMPFRMFIHINDCNGSRVCVGYTYSYFEFTGDISKRMTDEEWKKNVYQDSSWKNIKALTPRWYQHLPLSE